MSPLRLLPLCLLAVMLPPSSVAKKTVATPPAAPPLDFEALENVCDLIDMVESMYCYCDFLERGEGETANCLVHNSTRASDRVWDTFYHQSALHRLTISMRGQGGLDAVPTRALTYLHHLWTLEMKNAGIKSVHADAFGRSSSISDLVLARNSIEELERRSFSQLTNVTRLNLGENKLQVINRHVFVDMPLLKLLYLDRNRISRIRGGAFVQLESLQELELYDNALRAVSRRTFKGLSQLKRLDLHRNRLEVIGDRAFAEMPELTELDLAENRIKYISDHGLEGLPRLVRLILRDNLLQHLQPGTFQHTPDVFYLSLQQNRLETLDEKTFRPIMDNMNNITMYFYSAENSLQCDCRLAWLIRLRQRTASAHVKASLGSSMCHMEKGALPSRLADSVGGEVALGDSTPVAGLPVKLTDLKISELPCDRPLAEEPVEEESPRPRLHHSSSEGELALHQQKMHTVSAAPQSARSSQASPPPPPPQPAAAGEVKLDAAEATDNGNGVGQLAAQASLLLVMLAGAAAR